MAVNQCVVGVVDSVSASSCDFLTLVNQVNHCQPLSTTSIPSTTVTPVNYVNPSTTVNRVNHCQPPSPAFPAFNPFNRCVVAVVERTSASSRGFWPLSTVSTTFNHVQPVQPPLPPSTALNRTQPLNHTQPLPLNHCQPCQPCQPRAPGSPRHRRTQRGPPPRTYHAMHDRRNTRHRSRQRGNGMVGLRNMKAGAPPQGRGATAYAYAAGLCGLALS